MFVMMNAARLGVGMQGLGLTEISYQNARTYAKERIQMRALSGAKNPEKEDIEKATKEIMDSIIMLTNQAK